MAKKLAFVFWTDADFDKEFFIPGSSPFHKGIVPTFYVFVKENTKYRGFFLNWSTIYAIS